MASTRRSPSRSPGIPVDPAEVLSSSLEQRWSRFITELRRSRRRSTESSIHDLRVATRRLIATIDLVQTLSPDERLFKARRQLKKHLVAFSDLRDVHVQLLSIRGMVRAFPSLRGFRRELQMRERRLVRIASAEIARVKVAFLEQAITEMEMRLDLLSGSPSGSGAATIALRGAAATAFVRALERGGRIRPGDPRSIHRLRVAFKKFRYTLEALVPVLGWVSRNHLRAMNAYQVAMGEVQDAEVLLTSIRGFAQRRSQVGPLSFLPVYQHLSRLRAEQISDFMKVANDLSKFWK